MFQGLTALLIVAAAGVYFFGTDRVSLFDRDEPWYAQTSRQMLQSGDWLVPYFKDAPRVAKPIFIYWLQAASMKVFGDTAFAARFPSLVAMTLVLMLLAVVLHRFIGPRRAFFTLLIFSTSALVIGVAKVCLIDAVQLVFITVAQFGLYAVYRASMGRRGTDEPVSRPIPMAWLAALWISVGLAGLTKGPFILIVLLATMLVLAVLDLFGGVSWKKAIGWWPRLRPVAGLAVVAAIVLPWILTLYFRDAASRGFLKALLYQPIEHARGDTQGHAGPPGYHLAVVWIMYFPWSLLLPTALVMGFRRRATPAIRFALATVLGTWVFVELMVTKLPHYFLPAYAALAFLTADALVRLVRGQYGDWKKSSFLVGACGWAVGTALMAVGPWLAVGAFWGQFSLAAATTFSVLGLIYALVVFGLWAGQRYVPAVATMAGGMMVLIVVLYGWYLPQAQFLRMPQRLADVLQENRATEKGNVAMVDYNEPSLVFHQGGTIRDQALRWFLEEPVSRWPRWVAMSSKAFERLPSDKQGQFKELGRVRGLNYAGGGRIQEVLVLEKSGQGESGQSAVGSGQ